MINETDAGLESLADLFFSRARSFSDTARAKFLVAYQVSRADAVRVFPTKKWVELQDRWMLAKIRTELEEVFRSVAVRERFVIAPILKRLRGTGIWYGRFMRLAEDEWRAS